MKSVHKELNLEEVENIIQSNQNKSLTEEASDPNGHSYSD